MNSIRILHIDDDPHVRELVAMALECAGLFTVKSCGSGEDGLAAAAAWAPDLILCDVFLPALSGPDVLARLRDDPRLAGIPVIFATARSRPAEIAEFLAMGATAVIAKPFVLEELIGTICRYFDISDLAEPEATIAPADYDFTDRLRSDAATLERLQAEIASNATPSAVAQLRSCAHMLAGAAGIYGYQRVSTSATAVEDAIIEWQAGKQTAEAIGNTLDRLLVDLQEEAGPDDTPNVDNAFQRAI